MKIWVLSADSTRARIFRADSRLGPLLEVKGLVHPESRSKEQSLVSDSPGRGMDRTGAGSHSVGHESDAKRDEADRFARDVARILDEGYKAGRFERLHLVAAPAFLGMLRKHLGAETRKAVMSETNLNVTCNDPKQIRSRLPERL